MKNLLLPFFLILSCTSLFAQDNIFSIFSSSPLVLNPAATGTFGNKNLRLYCGSDNVEFKHVYKENFVNLAADKVLLKGKLGLGANVSNEFGNDLVSSRSAMLSLAWHQNIIKNKYTVSAGLQGGMVKSMLNLDGLYFESPLNPRYGIDSSLISGDMKDHVLYPDFNLGILAFRSMENSRFRPWIGFTIYHLFRPDVSFYGSGQPMPRSFLLHAGADISVTGPFVFSPVALYHSLEEFKFYELGGTVKYRPASYSIGLGGIFMHTVNDPFTTREVSMLALASYSGLEFRMEMFLFYIDTPGDLKYSRSMFGISWNLPEGKK
jgi:type IX secretion system PorP/SprF family membrane protein